MIPRTISGRTLRSQPCARVGARVRSRCDGCDVQSGFGTGARPCDMDAGTIWVDDLTVTKLDVVFADGFDAGDTAAWSGATP